MGYILRKYENPEGYIRLHTLTYGYIRICKIRPDLRYGYIRGYIRIKSTYGYIRLLTVTYEKPRLHTVSYAKKVAKTRLHTVTYGYIRPHAARGKAQCFGQGATAHTGERQSRDRRFSGKLLPNPNPTLAKGLTGQAKSCSARVKGPGCPSSSPIFHLIVLGFRSIASAARVLLPLTSTIVKTVSSIIPGSIWFLRRLILLG